MDIIIKAQDLLSIPITGQLDEFTRAAIKNYQLRNNIEPTGQPDSAFFDLFTLGQLDTSGFVSTNVTFMDKNEYYAGPTEKETIFLHHTSGYDNPYNVVRMWNDDNRGQIGTHFVIGGHNINGKDAKNDGVLVQAFPLTGYAWHLGIGNTKLHRNSVGIELCNFGWVKQMPGGFVTYTGAAVADNQVIELSKPWRGYKFFHKYSDSQISVLETLLRRLSKELNIDITRGLKTRLTQNETYSAFDYDSSVLSATDGLFCHTNVSPKNKYGQYEKWDMVPQPNLVAMINSL